MKDRVPEECCNAPGALNLVGATFEERAVLLCLH